MPTAKQVKARIDGDREQIARRIDAQADKLSEVDSIELQKLFAKLDAECHRRIASKGCPGLLFFLLQQSNR